MITLITYGTFDLFHVGHLNLLRRLKGMCDRLVVGVSTDEFNEKKGKKTIIPYAGRSEIVASIRYVDEVFPENCWEQKVGDIKKYGANIFAMGDDWIGKFDFLNQHCEVIYLPRTDGVSSTEIKNILIPFSGEKMRDLKIALDVVSNLVDQITSSHSFDHQVKM